MSRSIYKEGDNAMTIAYFGRIKERAVSFQYHALTDVIVVIDHDKGCSVTKDADAVIAFLAERFDLSKYRVVYQNDRGIWDQLRVEAGRFAGFRCLNRTTLEAAIEKLNGVT
jgi:hypothetical protein